MGCLYETEACSKHAHCITCLHYVEPHLTVNAPKTNADYLRGLTNKALAKWLVRKAKCTGCSAESCDETFCIELMEDWLEQPYEEEYL
jgi:hypothetical protein